MVQISHMRSLDLDDKLSSRISQFPVSVYKSEIQESIKSYFPGEWIFFKDTNQKKIYLGFINPLVSENYPAAQILCHVDKMPKQSIVEDYIVKKIKDSVAYRFNFKSYEKSSRIIFGEADGLPGLVADLYENACLVQINSAGMDKHRELIRETIAEVVKIDTYIVDGSKQRTQEMLPMYRESIGLDVIKVIENEFNYQIKVTKLQKNGWYFDHRENRKRLETILQGMSKEFSKGLDLFCYQGAWGFHVSRAGCTQVILVDQADMQDTILESARLNNVSGLSFYRQDVFEWLNDAIKSKLTFDVIVSDPPAFAKTKSEKKSAVDGYIKLHKKIMKISGPGAIVCFASCTHYVTEEEFLETIDLAARSEKRKIRILDRGQQAWDHPISHVGSRSNYIKSIIVHME
jgi:23S rRNA (cytosine1962-C5)-methyltransferase